MINGGREGIANLSRKFGYVAVLQINVSGTPPSPRSGHSAIAFGESLMVYGGMNGQDGVTFNDLFELRPGGWAKVGVGYPKISARTSTDSVPIF